jgi:hypothetical protein
MAFAAMILRHPDMPNQIITAWNVAWFSVFTERKQGFRITLVSTRIWPKLRGLIANLVALVTGSARRQLMTCNKSA